jgi:hypothetical protein
MVAEEHGTLCGLNAASLREKKPGAEQKDEPDSYRVCDATKMP